MAVDYKGALEYIHNISWTFCKPGLERTRELCQRLGNPQDKLRFIHVAGTNGKGSFSSMLSSILKEAGYRVGLYTSPYILKFNERMAINGKQISNKELAGITEMVKEHADQMQDKPTEFELVTAIAFEYFARNKCEYVVLECGLGGRLDSTNVIETPVLSVITGISLDHTSILGDTVEKIAKEKAGIIKKGVPVLWCGENREARAVIEGVAKEMEAPFYTPSHDELIIKIASLEKTVLDYKGFRNVEINLLGAYQPINCANVLEAVTCLCEKGLYITIPQVIEGLKKATWHARFERILDTPLVIFDGAHNPEGIEASVRSIRSYFGSNKVYTLTGVMADKDYSYMAKKIAEVSERVFCITPDNPRALSAEKYAEVFDGLGVRSEHFKTVKEATKCAILEAKKAGKALFCLGSLYMYGEVLSAIKSLNKD